MLPPTSTPEDYLDFYIKCKEIEKKSSDYDYSLEELYIETITRASKTEVIEGLSLYAKFLPRGWNSLYIQVAEYIETYGFEYGVAMAIYPMFALLENICFEIFELVDKYKLEKIKRANMHHAKNKHRGSNRTRNLFIKDVSSKNP